MQRVARCLVALLLLAAATAAQAAEPVVRVAVLKYGTASWELDTLRHHGLDRRHGVAAEVIELASPQAGQVALQAGAADLIVTDWLWVARQRDDGMRLAAAPYSTAVGGLMVPAGSPIRRLQDLKGRRIGVAGGPLDKAWLLLRAQAHQRDLDLAAACELVFGAPPLLNELALGGRIDAVLTYWHFAARLEGAGMREVLGTAEAARALGLSRPVALLVYAFREDWARANEPALAGFLAASRAAKAMIAADDAEWRRLEPLVRAPDAATAAALRRRYTEGIPQGWSGADEAEAAKLFAILAGIGGRQLVGAATALPSGTFWADARF